MGLLKEIKQDLIGNYSILQLILDNNLEMFDINQITSKKLKIKLLNRLLRKLGFINNINDKFGIYDWIDYDEL